MTKINLKLINFINKNSCFDLQFRRDVKHKRLNKPVYYCWKAQFILIGNYQDEDMLRSIQAVLGCGRLNFVAKNKIRYSVQSIVDLNNKVVPFFKKYNLSGNKKNDFELWAKGVQILFQNKGKNLSLIKDKEHFNQEKKWKKDDFIQVIEIQKEMQKYKIKKVQGEKWLPMAESFFE